ncbi:uncharacterized protein VTP21DRAFT_8857 [Calcarisporiella thermophila]|uniref:uncharacterized protein n=1 Tax=Calcarisporiella thermophila TaxID=911321 RepID=UPI003743668B
MDILPPPHPSSPEEQSRELPLFRNHFILKLASAPTARRVALLQNRKKIAVLRVDIPTVYGNQPILRRLDNGMVNATHLFRAAFPTSAGEVEQREMDWLKKYEGILCVEEDGRGSKLGAMVGVWVPLELAQELTKDYGLEMATANLFNSGVGENNGKFIKKSSPEKKAAKTMDSVEKFGEDKKKTDATKAEEEAVNGSKTLELLNEPAEEKENEKIEYNENSSEEQVVDKIVETSNEPSETMKAPTKIAVITSNKDVTQAIDDIIINEKKKRKLDDVLREEAGILKDTNTQALENQAASHKRKVRWIIGAAAALAATAATAAIPYFL